MSRPLTLKLFCILWLAMTSVTLAADFFVSPLGKDDWSGKLPDPDSTMTDGPKRTLDGVQAAWRTALTADRPDAVRVFLREGTWYVDKMLELTAADRAVPLSIEAYRNEKVVLHGSRPLTELQAGADGSLEGTVRFGKESDPFQPGRIFSGNEALVRARYPNFDPADLFRGGFLFVAAGYQTGGLFDGSVGNIHNPGDTLIYSIDAAKEGEYTVWVYYGANNASYNIKNVDGRMSFRRPGWYVP